MVAAWLGLISMVGSKMRERFGGLSGFVLMSALVLPARSISPCSTILRANTLNISVLSTN